MDITNKVFPSISWQCKNNKSQSGEDGDFAFYPAAPTTASSDYLPPCNAGTLVFFRRHRQSAPAKDQQKLPENAGFAACDARAAPRLAMKIPCPASIIVFDTRDQLYSLE
ncbi:hypothetical protein [Pararhizobium sp. O133]|uniref:hypothetical protein n=1 Tax=Pararhizobium sp. O133 TaxID=3449278 RepID=UPI003F684196